MADRSTSISLYEIGRYSVYILLLAATFILLFPLSNDLTKIAVALYTGISSIILMLYSIPLFFKSIMILEVPGNSTSRNEGVLYLILNFLPNLIIDTVKFISNITETIMAVTKLENFSGLNTLVVSYGVVSMAKVILFGCFALITEEDDSSKHVKAFLNYLAVNLIFCRLIMNADGAIKGRGIEQISIMDGLKSFFQKHTGNTKYESARMRTRRTILFVSTLMLSLSFIFSTFQAYSGAFKKSSLFKGPIPKLFLLADIEFLKTLCFELNGIDAKFINDLENYYFKV